MTSSSILYTFYFAIVAWLYSSIGVLFLSDSVPELYNCLWLSVCDLHWCQGSLSCSRTPSWRAVPKCCRGGTVMWTEEWKALRSLNKSLLHLIMRIVCFLHFSKYKVLPFFFFLNIASWGQVKFQKAKKVCMTHLILLFIGLCLRGGILLKFKKKKKKHCGLDCRQLPMMSSLFILCL